MNQRINAGADIHAGDGGYEISTQEKYEAFVKVRNKSLAQARIRELAEQNGFIHKWQPPGEQYEKLQTREKFAELIVRECAGVCDDERDSTDSEFGKLVAEGCALKIMERFGVEK